MAAVEIRKYELLDTRKVLVLLYAEYTTFAAKAAIENLLLVLYMP
jgi:hypothetical protein